MIHSYKAVLPPVLPFNIFLQLVGHMLGDGTVRFNASSNIASMAFEWKSLVYAQWVYNILSDYVISPIRKQTRISRNGTAVTTYCFQTISHSSLTVIYHLFIVNGVKTVPMSLVNYFMLPQTLATWFCDDGNKGDYRPGHGNHLEINTQSFTVPVVKQMVIELNGLYNLDARVREVKDHKPMIVIPSSSYTKFRSIVKPYMPECILYKIPCNSC